MLFQYFYLCADYRLVIICSSQEEEKCAIISQLHVYRMAYAVPTDVTLYQIYLRSHFISKIQTRKQPLNTQGASSVTASEVDPERLVVLVHTDQSYICSHISGSMLRSMSAPSLHRVNDQLSDRPNFRCLFERLASVWISSVDRPRPSTF